VERFRTHLDGQALAASSLNVHMSAIRKLAYEAADNGLIDPDLAAGIGRVRGAKRQGTRTGNWLTAAEASALLNVPDRAAPIGCRDRTLLGLQLGCGLRRAELVSLDVEHIQLREARWVILDLVGKGNRLRTVPMPAWAKLLLDRWLSRAGIARGAIFRSVNKCDMVLEARMTEDTVWKVVRRYSVGIGQPHLAPHDARRTCAKRCRAAGGEPEQIQLLLGHASMLTTEGYLGTRQNLVQAVNDQGLLGQDVG
jgi:integrase